MQSLPQGVSVGRLTRSESTPVVDYGRTALAGHADDFAQAGINQESDTDLRGLTNNFSVPVGRPIGYTNRYRMVTPQAVSTISASIQLSCACAWSGRLRSA